MKLPVRQNWTKPSEGERDVKVGDIVHFLCNGRGRGGHCMVDVKVTKINRVTLEGIECVRSYGAGTSWRLYKNSTNLCIVEENRITPEELAGVGVYRERWSPKPKAKDMEAFKASVAPEAYKKVLEEALSLVDQFPSVYKFCGDKG